MSTRSVAVSVSRRSPKALLELYADIMRELRRSGVVRSSNNPVADVAERIGAAAFGLTLLARSVPGYDARTTDGVRFQIKGRRRTPENASTQTSAIRGLKDGSFDYLLAILFTERFAVERAYRITPRVVEKHARFSKHVNAHLLVLTEAVLRERGVKDVTTRVRNAAKLLRRHTPASGALNPGPD